MIEKNTLVAVDGPVASVTLNRPDQLNPLDWGTVRELRAIFAELDANPEIVLITVTGAGRAFSAGGDLAGYIGLYERPDDFRKFLDDFFALCDGIERSPKAYLALVNGHCVAGGLELMLACDLVIASESAKIGDGHLNFGQLPGAGGSQRLPRAIGSLRAKQLLLTGDLIDGREAERFGLVNMAVPADQLGQAAKALADKILKKSRLGVAGAKHLVNEGMQQSLAEGLRMEIDFVHAYATESHDAKEGLRAFQAKRAPRFLGR